VVHPEDCIKFVAMRTNIGIEASWFNS